MTIPSTISEIGILETLRVISQNPCCMDEVAAYMPPAKSEFVEAQICFLADAVASSGKSALFMMSPETALMEQLAAAHWSGRLIIAIPFDIGAESEERIRANIPAGIHAEFVGEGAYPAAFRPDNGLIVCTGIVPAGHRQYATPSSCRMMSLYRAFRGDRLLLSCFPRGARIPQIGWTYTEADFFTHILG